MSSSCVNGRVNPSPQTKLRLFADSAGHCSKPSCHRYLFSDENVADYNIGEMAHIIAAVDNGPRSESNLDTEARAEYSNLILLCPSCHTEIDKAPEVFTVDMILDWKTNHKKRITNAIGIPQMSKRLEARQYVSSELRKNKAIFDKLNPNMSYRSNPDAEEAVVWKRKMLAQIIPNNQKILLFLDIHKHLLNEDELATTEEFRQHVDDLIERHLGNNKSIASKFPEKMNQILIN
ncbi:hypothetical protein SAMN05216490_2220 [Mucilaginibacter mallensis]|uniref:HNH endonuclease n=1 Tax=Mucilaginibacter mallensis TaxID=652787 RepID=A0A1H1WL78_MUCMA|nr:hypothetical protein [Mucilaginibacter mallensis]SDS97845.1 hypothetical protein SAMN05216490_2220 [Mucilaginibacter mallensis]